MTLLKELHSRPDSERMLALLQKQASSKLRPKGLLALHEALLFCKAYPRSEAIRAFCEAELRRFCDRVQTLEEPERAELAQSGIVGTHIYYPYDLAMAKWLMARLGDRIEVDWEAYAERDTDPLSAWLPLLAEQAEGDATDDPAISARDFIEATRGPHRRTSLAWLVNAFERLFAGPVGHQIYNAMNLSVDMELIPEGPSRTLLDDGPPGKLFLWDPEAARAKFDLMAEIRRPLRALAPVPARRGQALLDLARGTLLPRLRELYPATHGNPAEVYDVALERGVRMVVWFVRPPARLPLEADWGLLILKNHVPIGYGAGGMLADRSEIAINVFDTFRGGEAAWLYAQLARILNSFCHAPWLVTRRYQLGYENDEGLGSGSFWFYDRLGFRSVDPEIRILADQERARIARQKGYRSPRHVLKKLSQADAVLSLTGQSAAEYREFPLGQVGLAVSKVIGEQFGGERADLEERILHLFKQRFGISFRGWSTEEKSGFAQMGLFILTLPDVDRWPARDKIALFELCRLKGSAREADYARAFRKNWRFFEGMRKKMLKS